MKFWKKGSYNNLAQHRKCSKITPPYCTFGWDPMVGFQFFTIRQLWNVLLYTQKQLLANRVLCLTCGNIKRANFEKQLFLKIIFCKGFFNFLKLIWYCSFHIWTLFLIFFMYLGISGTYSKQARFWMCESSKSVCF